MTCPKCQSENQSGNFCSNCAESLKEKCVECGEMERVGRLVCEKMLKEAIKKREHFIEKLAPADYGFVLGLLGSLAIVLGMDAVVSFTAKWGIFLSAMSTFVYGFISLALFFWSSRKLQIKRRCVKNQSRQEFFQKFPEYAEILEKAKSAEAKSEGEEEKK